MEGLQSQSLERRSFYADASYCTSCYHKRYLAAKVATPTKKLRAGWRENKARQRERDPEGFAERERKAAARYRARHRERVLQDRAIGRQLAKEQKGMALKSRDKVKSTSGASQKGNAPEPFRAWLWTLIREEQRKVLGFAVQADSVPKNGVLTKVAETLEVSPRRLRAWLNEADRIDEMTLDRVCSHHGGIMPWEIYQRFADVRPSTLGELEKAEELGPVICRSRGCNEPAVVRYRVEQEVKQKKKKGERSTEVVEKVVEVRRWCDEHAEQLERVRQELQGDTDRFRAKIGKGGGRSTCCRPGCFEQRLRTERYCDNCQADGWREEDYGE